MKPKSNKYNIGNFFTFLFICIVLFIVIDIASRPFLSSRSAIEREFPVSSARKPYPYVMFSGKPSGTKLNTLGYVGPVPQKLKPEGEYRIIFLGGSTILNGTPPLPEIIQNKFEQNGLTNIKVYNFGVLSSVSGMELIKICTEVIDYDPDLIVMYNNGNDLTQPFFYDPRPGYPFNFMIYENNPLIESDINSYPTLPLLAYGSNIIRALFPGQIANKFINVQKLRESVGYNTPEWKLAVAQTYANNLKKAHYISQAFGADFIAFIQPMIFYKENIHPDEKKYLNDHLKEVFQEMRSLTLQQIDQIRQADDALQVVDLSDALSKKKDHIYTDFIHIKQEFKPFIAEKIYNNLLKLINE